MAFSDPENPHNPAHMIGNALDAILDALDRHISRNEPPPPAPSSKPREEKDNPPTPPVSQTPAAAPASSPPEEPRERGEGKSEGQQTKKRFEVPNREPSADNPDDFELGYDYATKRFRPNEVKTAWRLREKLQQPLRRSQGAGDWVTPDGKEYDAVGPVPDEYFNPEKFNRSIIEHLRKSGVTSVIDLTGVRMNNSMKVAKFLSALPSDVQAKILRIGF